MKWVKNYRILDKARLTISASMHLYIVKFPNMRFPVTHAATQRSVLGCTHCRKHRYIGQMPSQDGTISELPTRR